MKVAIIIMSILGCDDSVQQCSPIATSQEQWTTVAACDAASERELGKYTNTKYPMIVAVCQSADSNMMAEAPGDIGNQNGQVPAVEPQQPEHPAKKTLYEKAISLVTSALPSKDGLKVIVEKPVHIVTDTYSWLAKKITP